MYDPFIFVVFFLIYLFQASDWKEQLEELYEFFFFFFATTFKCINRDYIKTYSALYQEENVPDDLSGLNVTR